MICHKIALWLVCGAGLHLIAVRPFMQSGFGVKTLSGDIRTNETFISNPKLRPCRFSCIRIRAIYASLYGKHAGFRPHPDLMDVR